MEDPFTGQKLCGYLCTVLTVPPPVPANLASLTFLSPCQIHTNGTEIGFQTSIGILLSPITAPDVSNHGNTIECHSSNKRGRRRGGIHFKSGSVVHQILGLVMNKCLKVKCWVLHGEVRESENEGRVVVLVDVYLPLELWSGWQFPKLQAVAGGFFGHLSTDWASRRSMFVDLGEHVRSSLVSNKSMWDLSGCHVLGCDLHRLPSPLASRKAHFELHEIFKSCSSLKTMEKPSNLCVKPIDGLAEPGIWDVTDDLLSNILSLLGPKDLTMASATCHHLRFLALSIMPCMILKLHPHQQAAVEWMLQREQRPRLLPHPLYQNFSTEDGFSFSMNMVSGEIVAGMAPTVRDFRGGMFCDEPGLGKTITALSLILKTQGSMADPPSGVKVTWCTHYSRPKCGYYDLSSSSSKKVLVNRVNRYASLQANSSMASLGPNRCSSAPKRPRLIEPSDQILPLTDTLLAKRKNSALIQYASKVNLAKKNEELHVRSDGDGRRSWGGKLRKKKKKLGSRHRMDSSDCLIYNDTWVQCDACEKWRKVSGLVDDGGDGAWFCSMNDDPSHQSCRDPEEYSSKAELITYLPGFYTKGTHGGKEQNVSFFTTILKDHFSTINSSTKKALTWLVKLSPESLSHMETIGLASPILGAACFSSSSSFSSALGESQGFCKLFQAFGLVKRLEKGTSKWYYPWNLDGLVFDVDALGIAMCAPLDSIRFYLSRATLIVVPAILVDHWKTQIQKHIKPGQLRLCVWTYNNNEKKKRLPAAHSLAWDYDVVMTTFSRLSAEWSVSKGSPLVQVHWRRIMLDEGHTLGSSLTLTNKLQMAISLMASSRWLLTGTPTPTTPNCQLSHLQPMLRFLHEEAYGQNHKSWEAGILRPFEAEMEEGWARLVQLLHTCLISARKVDLKSIPPCIKKVKFLDFSEEHARSYNELVVMVRRNILMADWNDPSHVESLLNPKQWKFRSDTIRNVRLSCCVAGHVRVTDAGHDLQETMDILVARGLDPLSDEFVSIKHHLQFGGNCQRCREWCRLPVITPCRHLLCLDCVALDSEKCAFPGCGNAYEMQTPDTLTRPENPNPKWPVPEDLIELQPSYKQDDWDPDWQSTSSSKVAYLVKRLKELLESNSENSYCAEQVSVSKINDPCASLVLQCSDNSCVVYKIASEKVLIFSQFLEHIHVIEQQLTFAGIKHVGLYSPMHSSNKVKSLSVFQKDDTCMALLMDGSAALGLDLSFVTHVFLMEPIWDRSTEEQVISRAHRMGATRPIHVETLAMRGTIEEQMLDFLQDMDKCGRAWKEEAEKHAINGARSHRSLHDFAERNYLAQLSFVRITAPP